MATSDLTQIVSDGATVWVHRNGYTIGRFGKMGIDVHNETAAGCLHCTHEPTTSIEHWRTFQADMVQYHQVVVTDDYLPERLREGDCVVDRTIPVPLQVE